MVLVDTNVLIDTSIRDPRWCAWSSQQLSALIALGEAAINPIIYSELAPIYPDESSLDAHLVPAHLIIRLPLPYTAAFPAGRAFKAYRKAGGSKTSPLPDFYIGAHAEAEGLTILTRDPNRYRTYFPKVRLICP